MFWVLAPSLLALVYSQEALENPKCNGWLDPGECNNFTVKWYYDRYDHRCRRFFHGGCGGNENKFESLEECSATCHFREATRQDRCEQPHDAGHCESDIERWFFDWNKKQCVCSWWTGCGGNSNRYYSYNHCMKMCGEFAEHGPGIDENYWGKLNGSGMSIKNRNILDQYASNTQWTLDHYQNEDWGSAENYEDVDEIGYHNPVQQKQSSNVPPTSPPAENEANLDISSEQARENSWGPDRTPAISWAEFHGNSHLESTNQNRKVPEIFEPVPRFSELRSRVETVVVEGGSWENNTRGNDHNVYRFDSGPKVHKSPDGSVTTNRQVLVVLEGKQPRMTWQQNQPVNRLYLTRVSPPAHYSTMVPPIRRKMKKLKKQKTPPRQIHPEPTEFSVTYRTDRYGNQIRSRNEARPILPKYSRPSQRRYWHTERNQAAQSPEPTQIYATIKTDKFGRTIFRNKVTWTGSGDLPLERLPPEFRQFLNLPSTNNQHPAVRLRPQTPPRNLRTNVRTPARPRQHQQIRPTYPPTYIPAQRNPQLQRTPAQPYATRRQPPTRRPPPDPRNNVQAPPTNQRANAHYDRRRPTVAPQRREHLERTPARVRPTLPVREDPTRPPVVEMTTRFAPTLPPQAPPTRNIPTLPPQAPPTRNIPTLPPQAPPTRNIPTLRPHAPPTRNIPTIPTQAPPTRNIPTRPPQAPPTVPPTRRMNAEPVETSRPLTQRLTTSPPLSLDDIIAMDAEVYDDYEMPDELPEYETSISQVLLPVTTPPPRVTPPPRPAQQRQAPPTRTAQQWAPIVLPPKEHQQNSQDDFEFDIQAVPIEK